MKKIPYETRDDITKMERDVYKKGYEAGQRAAERGQEVSIETLMMSDGHHQYRIGFIDGYNIYIEVHHNGGTK